ncbi:hypothetical protein BGX33_010910 [Mortierella sp. NVP41]|nr:hypothetical protein BGX33_010910 [Mortierella sp. NVP41]
MLQQSTRIEEHQGGTNETDTLLTGSSPTCSLDTETPIDNTTQHRSATESPSRKRCTNELKDDHQLGEENDDHQGMISDQENGEGSVYKKYNQQQPTADAQSAKKVRHTDDTETDTETDTTLAASSAITTIVLVNPNDPCAVLPTEVWHQILSFLPPSGIARVSVVCKTWLEGSRAHPMWKTACEKGGLGEPDDLDVTWMALVCANSYWVCEQCFSVSKGHPRGSHIPLPIRRKDSYRNNNYNDDDTWRLCHACRLEVFLSTHYPTRIRDGYTPLWSDERIAAEDAWRMYYLTLSDLREMVSRRRPLPFPNVNGQNNRFLHYEVKILVVWIHGGWEGVDAVERGLAEKRQVEFEQRQLRDRAFRLDKDFNVLG